MPNLARVAPSRYREVQNDRRLGMTLTPYLFFQGNCEAAMTFYAGLFGTGPLTMMRMADGPPGMPIPEGAGNKVMHAVLPVAGGQLYAADDIAGDTPPMQGASVMLEFPDFDRASDVFEALSTGGSIRMPFEAQFWTPGFGSLTDPFGIRWMIGVQATTEGA
jgi:PhnB protein